MNQQRFNCLLFFAATLFLLSSCSGDGSKEKTNTDTAAKAVITVMPPVMNTIVTTPQNFLVVIHKVKNFAKWKVAYDTSETTRLASGIHNYRLGRGLEDSNMVFVPMKIDDPDKAKAFAYSANLKHAMEKAGVIGAPSIDFVTIVFRDTSAASTDLRSRTTFTVKDWDTWKKSFDSTKQIRLENGVDVKSYGHDISNDHNIVLVAAITDTAKAHAFWKSDELKKRMVASGVIGKPKRFLYRMVQKY